MNNSLSLFFTIVDLVSIYCLANEKDNNLCTNNTVSYEEMIFFCFLFHLKVVQILFSTFKSPICVYVLFV